MLSLDFIAKRYSKLPSEVIESGSSIDLQIANLAIEYESYLTKKAQNSKDGGITSDLSQEEMQAMLDRVRKKT